MAFKDCFYLQFLKDEDPGIDFAEEDFNWQPVALKPDLYYGYEKPDGSEPDWVKIGFGDGEARHIDVTIGQKIYFKGTMPLSAIYTSGQSSRAHHDYKWFSLTAKGSETMLKVGGCVNSMYFDGDGSPDLLIPGIQSGYYMGFYNMFRAFPGYLYISDFILPTNTINGCMPVGYMFDSCPKGFTVPRNFFKKHKLCREEYAGFFQNTPIHSSVFLPFTSDDLGHRSLGAMFYYGKVEAIHVKFTSWSNATWAWADSTVAPDGAPGDFYCPETLPIQYATDRIPANWTVNPPLTAIVTNYAAKYKLGDRSLH